MSLKFDIDDRNFQNALARYKVACQKDWQFVVKQQARRVGEKLVKFTPPKTAGSLCINGKPAYKAAFFGNTLFYAERGDSDGFEERHIASSDSYEKALLNFDEVVSVETEKPTQGTIELLKHFTKATIRFAKSGFKIADTETLAIRKAICDKCEFWDSTAFFGRGKCRKCGCSSAKLRLASEKCPIGKWRFCL